MNFSVIETEGVIIKAWDHGVQFEEKAIQQLKNVAKMPFVAPYVAAMPDTHWGMGCTVGSVIPTVGAIIPAAVGVDIGCGMMAVRITEEPWEMTVDFKRELRLRLEKVIPHGRTNHGGEGDRGAWHNVPEDISEIWQEEFMMEAEEIFFMHPGAESKNASRQLGTLGTGNHFLEVCEDELRRIWIVLHSGSRGFGNKIGSYFTKEAKQLCAAFYVPLPDPDLAFLPSDSFLYREYIKALVVSQRYAWRNREIMMARAVKALGGTGWEMIHCHHNYMSQEEHFGKKVILTRKGAVDASKGAMVVIPGSMGAATYICRGLGSPHSFRSCSHGAGRSMGRRQAEKTITAEDHKKALEGIECHSGSETIDESPAAYKPIDAVMAAQTDLVEPVHVLHQLINVKGWEK